MPAPRRTARIEDDIWDPATVRAKAEGASFGALMRAAVQRYASGQLTSTAEPASHPAATLTSQPHPPATLLVRPPRSSPSPTAIRPPELPAPPPDAGSGTPLATACAACPCAPPAAQRSRARIISGRSPKPRHAPSAAAPPDPPSLTRRPAHASIRGSLSANPPVTTRPATTRRCSPPPSTTPGPGMTRRSAAASR